MNKKQKPKISKKKSNKLVPVVKREKSLVPLDPLQAYLQEVRKHEGLTEEEERELAIKFKEEGDLNAAYRLTTANLMLVVKIAMAYQREWQNLMDLIQEGNVGLMKAVKNFDPFRGVPLSAYAGWWIKSYILKFILDNWRLVKVGTTNVRRKLLFNLNKEKEKIEREGLVPTTKLLAERFGVDEGEVIDVEAGIGAADISLDTPTDEETTLIPIQPVAPGLSPEKHVEAAQFLGVLKNKINDFKEGLKPIELDILEKRVLSENPLALKEIGDQYEITREAVRQAEQRLLKKFKTYIEETMPEAADYFQT